MASTTIISSFNPGLGEVQSGGRVGHHEPSRTSPRANHASTFTGSHEKLEAATNAISVSTATGGSFHLDLDLDDSSSTVVAKAPGRPSTTPDSSAPPVHMSLHAHRQNHNSSKLPAFRFADRLKTESLGLAVPSLFPQNHHVPPTPLSPEAPEGPPAANPSTDPTDEDGSNGFPNHPQPAGNPAYQQGHSSGQQAPIPTTTVAASAETHQLELPATPFSPQLTPTTSVAPATQFAFAFASATATATASTAESASSPAFPSNNSAANLKSSPILSRSSTFPASHEIASDGHAKQSASRPESPPDSAQPTPSADANSPQSASSANRFGSSRNHQQRCSAASSTEPTSPSSLSFSTRPQSGADHAQEEKASDSSTKEWAQGQRDLVLPQQEPADEKKRFKSRPPVSYKPPRKDGSVRVPPIRSFRSSGSRKSWTQDMNNKRRSYDEGSGDDSTDPYHHDRALWALEGRTSDGDYVQMTPPDSAEATPDHDNTTETDIFMRIAREDPVRRAPPEDRQPEDPSAISRVVRSSHRRPLSAAIPSQQIVSPPQVIRRLSDQRETSLSRRVNEQSAQHITRELAYRAIAKEKPGVVDENSRSRPAGSALKASPITPRFPVAHDMSDGLSTAKSQRRTSITENPPLSARNTAYKFTYGNGRSYNPSPLAPRNPDHPQQSIETAGPGQAVEGTESSASTAAPSTVWDELDDIRTRIHRLEATGKAPPASRASDDRPPTANTNATTISASPKRGSSNLPADASSTTSSQRESQPILLSALSKTKQFISNDAYEALESAANEALALSQMMGTPGQPGPISSGASTIGGAGSSITDRQLRRKADSICRSLTEVCLALAEEGVQRKIAQATSSAREKEVTSPTGKALPMASLPPMASTVQRRPTAPAESGGLSRLNTAFSPRAAARAEERRVSLLTTTALPSPRYSMALTTPTAEPGTPGRKTSLYVNRTRRAVTEEPEEMPSGRKSSLLRTRRAGTEEPEEQPSGRKSSLLRLRLGGKEDAPEEGRKTSFLSRGQRVAANDEDEGEVRFRAPSRAVTEVGALRALPRDYLGSRQQQQQQQQQQAEVASPTTPGTSLGNSALPRRRLVPSSLSSRLSTAAPPVSLTGRRFLDRGIPPERETVNGNSNNGGGGGGGGGSTVIERLAEDRGQRQFSLSQTAVLNRTSSLSRRRESGIPSFAGNTSVAGTSGTAHAGWQR